MSPQRRRPASRLDARRPLVLTTRSLSRSPGSQLSRHLTAPAPAGLGAGMVSVPEGAEMTLDVQLTAVTEGVLVTAEVTAPLTGECARCLDPLAQRIDVRFQELFNDGQDQGPSSGDGYPLEGDLLDLEPVLRDALVLALPLAPLCREDCPGLCPECGVQLARAGRDHSHAAPVDPRWAALAHMTEGGPDGSAAPETRQESGRGRP
ncbi:MAG: DUF177 domain-containing protein [Actinobacteria bacterium]|nr:DUF177 domain-containing protein [Actinomycetota bacterium]